MNFAKNAFIILPYTHDIHVLAVHVETSLFMILNKLNRLSPELRCFTFKIHYQECNLHGAERTPIGRVALARSAGSGVAGSRAPAAQIGSGTLSLGGPGARCAVRAAERQRGLRFRGNGGHLFGRVS